MKININNKMYYDCVALLVIICLSYLFALSITKNYDPQAMFILLSCLVLIIYKCLVNRHIYQNVSKENFSDFTEDIQQLIDSDIPAGANPMNTAELYNRIKVISDKLSSLNENLDEIKNINKEASLQDASNAEELSLQASQQIQDFRIKKMEDETARLQDLVKKNQIKQESAKFKKIPIYSSCVVSNADGSISNDLPSVSNKNNGSLGTVGGVPVSNTPSAQQQSSASSSVLNVTNVPGVSSNSVSNSQNDNSLVGALKSLFSGDKAININLN